MALANLSATANDCYIGGPFYMMWWLAGDALMKCGYIVADHATNDAEVIICGTSGIPFGVTALQDDVDIDTLLSDGTTYKFYALHAGTALRVGYEDAVKAIKLGEAMSKSATTAGTVLSGRTAGSYVGTTLVVEDAAQNLWIEVMSTAGGGS